MKLLRNGVEVEVHEAHAENLLKTFPKEYSLPVVDDNVVGDALPEVPNEPVDEPVDKLTKEALEDEGLYTREKLFEIIKSLGENPPPNIGRAKLIDKILAKQ